ncbi:uncharacterized protein RCH25_043424 [Pelodytes ibericus]
MPKSCAIPGCKSQGSGGYYKFPLQDKVRLKQWLANMNMENFLPTKNQYLCCKHFKPSCFQFRWGVRLLKPDAAPTIFPFTGGALAKTHRVKSRTPHSAQNVNVGLAPLPVSGIDTQPQSAMVGTDMMAIAVDPKFSSGQVIIGAESLVKDIAIPSAVTGAVNLVPLVHFVKSFDGLSLALTSQAQGLPSIRFDVAGEHQVHGIPLSQPISFITEEQIASTSLQHDLFANEALLSTHGAVPAIINVSHDGTLMIQDISIVPFSETGFQPVAPAAMSPAELAVYLETMQKTTAVPTLQTSPLPPLMPSSETVLSHSITAPISSTVPIVSKRATLAAQCIPELEEQVLDCDELPESLSTPEMFPMAVDLQKKVRTPQKRPRGHSSKLEVLEGVLEQLKKENIISDENLNLVEVACAGPSSAVPETNNTFAVVCQENEQTLMYALPLELDTGNQTVLLSSTECDQTEGCIQDREFKGISNVRPKLEDCSIEHCCPLDGSIEHRAPLDGSIEHRGPLDGSIEHCGPLDGSIEHRGPLDGSIEHRGPLDGSIEHRAPLDGSIEHRAPLDGSIEHRVPLDGSIEHRGPLDGSIEYRGPLDGSVEHPAPLDGSIEHRGPLDGSVEHPAPLDGSIEHPAPLDGSIVHPAPFDGSIVHPAPFDGSIVHPAPLDGSIEHPAPLDGSIEHPAPLDGSIEHPAPLDGSIEHPAPLDGSIEHRGPLDGSIEHRGLLDSSIEHPAPLDGSTRASHFPHSCALVMITRGF